MVGCLDEFVYGIILAKIITKKIENKKIITEFRFKWAILLIATVLVSYVSLKIYWNNSLYWDNIYMVAGWRSMAGLSAVLLLATSLYIKFPQKISSTILKPFYYTGEVSYGIYLWHPMAIEIIKKMNIENNYIFLLFTMVLTFMLASFSWHFVEKPIIKKYR